MIYKNIYYRTYTKKIHAEVEIWNTGKVWHHLALVEYFARQIQTISPENDGRSFHRRRYHTSSSTEFRGRIFTEKPCLIQLNGRQSCNGDPGFRMWHLLFADWLIVWLLGRSAKISHVSISSSRANHYGPLPPTQCSKRWQDRVSNIEGVAQVCIQLILEPSWMLTHPRVDKILAWRSRRKSVMEWSFSSQVLFQSLPRICGLRS